MDKIILSYYDACLYESDYSILKADNSWLNDRIISFYFEYLQRAVYENGKVLFIGPEVSQTIKMIGDPHEVNAFILNPLSPANYEFIMFAVNDNSSVGAGGSHWSLCVFSKPDKTFFHFDSSSGSNKSSCVKIVKILKSCLSCEAAGIKDVKCLQQRNSYDCGTFLLCHADLICSAIDKGKDLTSLPKLQPETVATKRREMVQIVQSLGGKI